MRHAAKNTGAKYAEMLDCHSFPLDAKATEIFGTEETFSVLLRPDNHIGLITSKETASDVQLYLDGFIAHRVSQSTLPILDHHPQGDTIMQVMVIVKADKNSEAGIMPSEQLLTEMGKYNEELVEAGVMLAGEGLHPSSRGVRVKFSGNERTVTEGPFSATEELIAGFWLWKVKSMDEAIEWLKRAPFDGGAELEIRPIFEAEDFGEEFTPELREQEERLRARLDKDS